MMNRLKQSKTVYALVCMVLITSCITQRNLEYMKDHGESFSYPEPLFSDYKLKANDALYIQIKSIDDAESNVFAQGAGQQSLEPYGAYMNSYTVSKDGNVLLPVIGEINVLGKTTSEVSDMIRDSVTNILSLPTVTVRLVNQYVTVLGEVNSPGHYVYSQDKLTIFNALGLAGDISEYGNRKQVVITRNENGKNIKTTIDLTQNNILTSKFYYLQPNDMVYVSPLVSSRWLII